MFRLNKNVNIVYTAVFPQSFYWAGGGRFCLGFRISGILPHLSFNVVGTSGHVQVPLNWPELEHQQYVLCPRKAVQSFSFHGSWVPLLLTEPKAIYKGEYLAHCLQTTLPTSISANNLLGHFTPWMSFPQEPGTDKMSMPEVRRSTRLRRRRRHL